MRSPTATAILLALGAALSPSLQAQNAGGDAVASSASARSPEVQQMQAVESSWDAAVAKRDQYALENLLSPNFVDISAAGDVTTRNQQISHLFVQGAEPLSLKQTVIDARMFGDVAVVNGTYVMEWPVSGGEKMAEKGVFTHVFQRGSSGSWQCVNAQRTVVADQVEGRKARKGAGPAGAPGKVPAKSNTPLPFHVPLVYKGPQSTKPQPDANTQPQ